MKISRSAEGGQPSAGVWGILSGGQVIGDPNHPSLNGFDIIRERRSFHDQKGTSWTCI